ncbi:hypothetical protein [Undibacterium terreum]|uniref:Uncharacterized protein n=1 Tax=Undibacterium terreum TaxID=1224302 RepID=A0A916V014_9BURK|nr:hypothetical protein [Undibacterium terreum]GGC93883.1 hypothetical protein GCM10011396_46500 [Undibacterium terreum]
MKHTSMKQACCLLLLSALCQLALAETPPYQIRRIDSSTVAYHGVIGKGSTRHLLPFLDAGTDTLVVTSAGGSADEGMRLAEELRKRHIRLVVDKYCMSSCANYLFLAARQKSVNPGSLIGFHGAPLGSLSEEKERQFQQGRLSSKSMKGEGMQNYLDKLAIRELEFFAEIGVDRGLYRDVDKLILDSVAGKNKAAPLQGKLTLKTGRHQWDYGVSDAELDKLALKMAALDRKKVRYTVQGEIERPGTAPNTAYFPSRATLEKYGVMGIQNYPYPADHAELKKLVGRVFDKGVHIIADFATLENPAG